MFFVSLAWADYDAPPVSAAGYFIVRQYRACNIINRVFYPDSSVLSRNLFEVFFPSTYPAGLYQNCRAVFLYVIPSLAIAVFRSVFVTSAFRSSS